MKASKKNGSDSTFYTKYHLPYCEITYSKAFTIVELLVVIVVIAILAAITIVSFTGISQKAVAISLQSDLSNAKKQIALYYTEHSTYPASIDSNTKCPLDSVGTADTKYCLKPSSSNVLTYTSISPYSNYSLTNTNANTTRYTITNDSGPTALPTITIDTQTWMQYNLNVGIRKDGSDTQANNSIIEKYCYADTESNCTTYGGLYQWNEAMQYVTTAGAQGICPASFHIPTDNDWKILEMQLGMSQVEADTTGWRGTHQEGTQLKSGGTSGLNIPLAGNRRTDESFLSLSSRAYLWSSSELSASAWDRLFELGDATVYHGTLSKAYGFSVRCVGN